MAGCLLRNFKGPQRNPKVISLMFPTYSTVCKASIYLNAGKYCKISDSIISHIQVTLYVHLPNFSKQGQFEAWHQFQL